MIKSEATLQYSLRGGRLFPFKIENYGWPEKFIVEEDESLRQPLDCFAFTGGAT